jgi:hypothetical protein
MRPGIGIALDKLRLDAQAAIEAFNRLRPPL